MKHLGSGHQYTPMMVNVAIDTGNGQRDVDNDEVLCTYMCPDVKSQQKM